MSCAQVMPLQSASEVQPVRDMPEELVELEVVELNPEEVEAPELTDVLVLTPDEEPELVACRELELVALPPAPED